MSTSLVVDSRLTVGPASLMGGAMLEQIGEVAYDLVCLSHLRWDFVYQRPQHLLCRFARNRRVFYVEEPIYTDAETFLSVDQRTDGLYVVQMYVPRDLDWNASEAAQRELIDQLFATYTIARTVLWYFTAMPLGITDHLRPAAIVYDCMDELSAFAGAPPLLREREHLLLARADLVFTGGQSLYEAKRDRHPSVHCFPSSVDVAHFARARALHENPPDQAAIRQPRMGFFGVLDERLDQELIANLADARPDWQIILIGPIVKIDPQALPQRPNLHYLGPKPYADLPMYLAGWDVALLPFARNDATRFISPTKTPEYLAAGKPVVSAPIQDVIRPYGQQNLVQIADTVDEWIAAIERALAEPAAERLPRVDSFLAEMSWDRTWSSMAALIADVVQRETLVSGPAVVAVE